MSVLLGGGGEGGVGIATIVLKEIDVQDKRYCVPGLYACV